MIWHLILKPIYLWIKYWWEDRHIDRDFARWAERAVPTCNHDWQPTSPGHACCSRCGVMGVRR